MTVENWITVAVGGAAIVATFAVGYLHRKQMRQIEAYRQDPSAGLIPPPHPITIYALMYSGAVWNFGYGTYLLVRTMLQSGPVTRDFVFDVNCGIGSILFGILLFLLSASTQSVFTMFRDITAVLRDMETLGRLTKKDYVLAPTEESSKSRSKDEKKPRTK